VPVNLSVDQIASFAAQVTVVGLAVSYLVDRAKSQWRLEVSSKETADAKQRAVDVEAKSATDTALNNRVAVLESRLTECLQTERQLRDRIGELTGQNAELQRQLGEQAGRIRDLETELREANGRAAAMHGEFTELQHQLKTGTPT
jgi:chromosome segregation ATPase